MQLNLWLLLMHLSIVLYSATLFVHPTSFSFCCFQMLHFFFRLFLVTYKDSELMMSPVIHAMICALLGLSCSRFAYKHTVAFLNILRFTMHSRPLIVALFGRDCFCYYIKMLLCQDNIKKGKKRKQGITNMAFITRMLL